MDAFRAGGGRRAVGGGLSALLAALIIAAVSAPTAFAGASGCADEGRAHNIQTLSPATCADAQAVVPGYYGNTGCFSNEQLQNCSVPASNTTWRCSGFEGRVQCSGDKHDGSNVEGIIKWTHGADTGSGPPISGLTITPFAFRALAAGGPVVTRGGAVVTFKLRQAGNVSFGVYQTISGRKVGPGPNGCKPQNQFNRTRPRCTKTQGRGGFDRQGNANVNQFRFSGRVGGRKLPPGLYVLKGRYGTATTVVSKGFRILAPPRR